MTWRQILEAGKGQLKAAGVAEYELDAWYLFEYAFGISRAHFYLCAKDEETASSEQREVYETYLKRREAREPLQYILGEQEFMGLSFYVNRHVLIPRQDTEILVETVLSRHERKETSILDMCAGSGCIAVSLAALGGYFCIMGADISHEAVFTARKNAARLCGSGTVRFRESDLFSAFSAEERFDVIVSNPPYSIRWAGDGDATLINDPRFAPAGVLAPKSKADLAFIMHSLSWLAANGTAAIVCFPGIMYRGGAEKKIRQYLIDNNFVACVIQLPANLFFGTSIATCIMVLKKGKADNKTLFIDASGECVKVTNNNRLTAENIERIVSVFATREEIRHFSHLAEYSEISGNDYNLSVSTYVEAEDTREKIDISKLNAEIEEIVAREQVLRDEIAKIIAEIEVDA